MSQYDDTDSEHLMKTLAENFSILADEVQLLSDRKTILEHKLRFAHEQYQLLADKFTPSDPQTSSTLAKLQLPPELQVSTPDRATFVPLPSRRPTGSKQQTAEAIRDGRRAAQKLASTRGWSSSGERTASLSGTTSSVMRSSKPETSATTILEQDFTIPGKKSRLLCPFASNMTVVTNQATTTSPRDNSIPKCPIPSKAMDQTPHMSSDPTCAAMYAEHRSPQPSVNGSSGTLNKCPIRYLDQHSPEEVAAYFETHKHEIPRSHEVCVKRYQRNEDDIRKLDAKYGNLVSMLQGLGQKHQPMLPSEDQEEFEGDSVSNERVENWAKAVSANGLEPELVEVTDVGGEEREGRFDRPLKEVRVGESPSRPWGISVPFTEVPQYVMEEVPAPPSQVLPHVENRSKSVRQQAGKCPFGHGEAPKPTEKSNSVSSQKAPEVQQKAGKCPFGQRAADSKAAARPEPSVKSQDAKPAIQPIFFQQEDLAKAATTGIPHMIFNGPVFIGYSTEQAMSLMQAWQAGAANGRA